LTVSCAHAIPQSPVSPSPHLPISQSPPVPDRDLSYPLSRFLQYILEPYSIRWISNSM
jgi:hypothetical protein